MLTITYTDTFDYPTATVFALLTDLEARSAWITGILEIRVTPAGPARLGTSYFEAGKFSGYKSEKTLLVAEFEQGQLLTLATPAEAKAPWRESYRLDPLSDQSCRVHITVEVGGAPKVAEFFMQQSMKKEQPLQTARLKSILANQSPKTN